MDFRQLLSNAQFHGSKRLSEGRYWYWWFICLLLLFLASVDIVIITVWRFFDQPTYMSITETKEVSRRFPGVFICPEIHFPDYKMDEFVSQMIMPPNIEATEFRAKLRQLAAFWSPDMIYNLEDLKMVEYVLNYNMLGLTEAGQRLTATCEEILWNELRQNKTKHSSKAQRSQYFSPLTGLVVVVNSSTATIYDIDLSYKWAGLIKTMTYLEIGINGTPVSPNTELWLGYLTHNIISTEETKMLSDELRGCELASQKLQYFPFYSKSNCRVECEMARMLRRCNCIPITHPRPQNVPACGAGSLSCVKKAAVTYDSDQCRCPISCDMELETVTMSTYPLSPADYSFDSLYTGLDMANMSIVRAFLAHQDVKSYTRMAYFRSYDLFSQLGGVFNVFFGCSVLTMLELTLLVFHRLRERWWKVGKAVQAPPPALKKKKMKKQQKTNVGKKIVKQWKGKNQGK